METGPSTGRLTVTANVHMLVAPHVSQAVMVTVLVEGAWKIVPEGGEEVTVTSAQALVATVGQVTCRLVEQVSAWM